MAMATQSKRLRQKGQCRYIKKREFEEIEEMKKKKARVDSDVWLKHQTNFAWKQGPHAN